VYDFQGLMTGYDDDRQARFQEAAGWQADDLSFAPLRAETAPVLPYLELVDLMGVPRTDVFRDTNTRHLLGNYPTALVRTGYDFLVQAHEVARSDTFSYDRLTDKALAAFQLAARFDPTMQPVNDILPVLLVEKRRSAEALAFLAGLQGKVPAAQEEQCTFETIFAMTRVGQSDLASRWLEEQIGLDPGRKFFYDILFRLYQHLGRLESCREVMNRWAARSGQADPTMVQAIQEMEDAALAREQERIERAVEEGR